MRAGGFRVGIVEEIKSARTRGERRGARDRRARPRARQEHRAAVGGLDAVGAPALGARAQVRRADPGPRQAAPSRTATRSRCANASQNAPELEDVLSTFAAGDPQRRPQRRSRASATRSPAAARPSTRTIRELEPVHALPAAGDAQPLRPEDRAAQLLPGARSGGRAGGAGGRGPGPLVRRDGHHLRGDRARPRGAAGDDRGEPADAPGRDRVVPGPDAVPRALRRRVARPPARRRRSCRARCRS